MEKYLYFRTEADVDDDAASNDSAVFPASNFMGMHPTSDSALTLFFKCQIKGSGQEGAGDALANLENHDSVILNVGTHTHKSVMASISKALNTPVGKDGGFVVIADDATTALDNSTIVAEYIDENISSCGAIAIAVALAN